MTIPNHASDLEQIEQFPAFVKQAILRAEGTPELVDTLGAINSTQTAIGKIKRGAASEVEPEDTGDKWEFTQPMKGMRSYNTPGMFITLMNQLGFDSLLTLIQFLMGEGVLRLSWQWTPLEKLVRERDVFLRTTNHEIEDGDPDYDMGEYWVRGSASYKRVEEADG